LETALRPVPATSDAAKAKNQIRQSISNLFPNRDSFTLVRPMNDEKMLQNMSALSPEEFRPEFRSGIKELLRRVFLNATPKMVGGAAMNGPMLAGAHALPTLRCAPTGVAMAVAGQGSGTERCGTKRMRMVLLYPWVGCVIYMVH
jgi:hypothetical protein